MKDSLSQPKQTFLNLADEKRAMIEEALVGEFATKGYQKASLNVVVKQLNIAKGSLYQYFDNKESIFLYVFDCFTQLIKKSVEKTENQDAVHLNFWQALRSVMYAGIEFIQRYPLYFQLYLQVLHEENIPQRDELIVRVRLFSKDYFGPMVEACQRQGVFVQTPVATIIFIIDAVMDRFFQTFASKYLVREPGINQKWRSAIGPEIEHIIETLKFGIASRSNRSADDL